MSWENDGNANDGFGEAQNDTNNGGNDGNCFNCGQPGHMKSDCPNPRVGGENSGECYNCGQTGHNKADCPNPTVAREFTGTCRICELPGHRASDCPTAPPKMCKNCGEEGHTITACKNPRKIDRSGVEVVQAETAWEEITAAVARKDMDDVNEAFQKYVKACPIATYSDLEEGFRTTGIPLYIIAMERELALTYTNMDLQGNLDKTYTVSLRFSPEARRPKEALGWPESPEENMERLKDAGQPVNRGIPKCNNCEELGHVSKSCPEDKREPTDRASVTCFNCEEAGHRMRDCTKPREDRFACRNCKKSGHGSKECPEPRSAEGVECKNCNEIGHFSRDCPTGGGGGGACHNCGQEGHRSKECPEPRIPTCRNCDEKGHISKECPKPRDYSRVECQNCHQKGHTKVRCKEPIVENAGDDAGGFSGGAAQDDKPAASNGAEDWDISAPANDSTGGGFGNGDFGGSAAPVNASGGRGFGGGASTPVNGDGFGGSSAPPAAVLATGPADDDDW